MYYFIYDIFLVRTIFGESIKAIYKHDRKDWVLSWPGQIVIAGSQTFWTAEVERGLRDNKLDKFLNKILLANVSFYNIFSTHIGNKKNTRKFLYQFQLSLVIFKSCLWSFTSKNKMINI